MSDEPADHNGQSTEDLGRRFGEVTEPDSGEVRSEKLADRLARSQELPDHIGPFKILEVLGEGGMGIVYLAEQSKPIRRRVALKLIKLGMDTKQVIARFEAERQALALMNHPNVAKIFDAGATPDGRLYFVMEYVPGVPITDHCDRQRLNMVDRLELFRDVCQAVQHAHHKGIIHRDIKPHNILVTILDGKAVPKVIDFGVAKATQQQLTEKSFFTEQGQLIGTPEYMSPEQAERTAQDIDTRTDIYSLGVVLYELLAGALPFEPRSLRQAGWDEIHRIIREVDPPKPSTKLSSLGEKSGTVARNRRTDRASLERELRGDLDWIIMKAMEKDRTRRYANASELAEDIARHLRHEPVLASPPGAIIRIRKFVRRNRSALLAWAAIIGIASTAFAFSQYKKHRDAREKQVQRWAQADQHIREGVRKQQEGNHGDARRSFEQALIYDPNEFRALANLANLRLDQYFGLTARSAPRSLLEDANVLYERALDISPQHSGIWNVKCVALYALGNLAEAEQACRTAIQSNRDSYTARFNLAKVLALQHRIDEALAAATQAVETATQIGEANDPWAAGAWQTLATIQLHLGKPDAMQSLERAFECEQQDEWGYILRARLRLTLTGYKDLKGALNDATTANQISKVADPRIKRTLALACLRNGKYEDGVEYAGEALELGGLTAAHHLILAIAHAHLAHPSVARDHFDAALAAWPDNLGDDGLIVTADREGLWFDTLEALEQLRSEAESLIGQRP